MLLIRLQMTNFRQFYNKAEIIFSTNKEKNITLIHGENGVGKTTILNSILWCLYGKLTSDFERPQELVSLQAVKEGIKSCKVELSFEYENNNYQAQRIYQNSGQILFKLFEINEGNFIDIPNPKAFINSILPEDMAEYFFFHGEGVSNINANQTGSKFRRAIRDILGFRLAETAIEDLKDIQKKWTKELSDLNNVNKEQSELFKKKLIITEKIDELDKILSNIISEKEQVDIDLEKIHDKLRTCSHDDAKKLQYEVDVLSKKISENNGKFLNTKSEKQSLIKKYGWIIFGQKLANQGLDFIDLQSFKAKLPAPYDESLVKDLIEREYCICGRVLQKGTNEYNEVTKLIEKADNAIIRQKILKARSGGDQIKSRFNDFLSDLQKIESNLFEIDNYKRDLDIDLSEKQDRLKEIDVEEVRQLESLKDKYKNKLSTIEQSIGSKKRNLDILKRELQDVELKLKKYGTEDIRIQRLSKHQEFSGELIKLCTSKLKEYEDESKKTIAVKVNQTLQQFSRKDFTIKVSEDFSFYLIREDGQKVAKSRGENLLLNLSFVSALIEFAQMRSGASGEFLVKGTTAPFVIDAPFGELDNTYKQATAEFLPKRSRQLIFLLSSSHWMGTVDDTIKNLVGEEYILISSKSSLQKNKPEDLITINQKEYIQSMYNQPKDATFIERID